MEQKQTIELSASTIAALNIYKKNTFDDLEVSHETAIRRMLGCSSLVKVK